MGIGRIKDSIRVMAYHNTNSIIKQTRRVIMSITFLDELTHDDYNLKFNFLSELKAEFLKLKTEFKEAESSVSTSIENLVQKF